MQCPCAAPARRQLLRIAQSDNWTDLLQISTKISQHTGRHVGRIHSQQRILNVNFSVRKQIANDDIFHSIVNEFIESSCV